MAPVTLRSETPADAAAIERVVAAAFEHAEHSSGTEPLIVAALRRSGRLTTSLVAIESARIVGHVALSPVTISDGTAGWFGLGPVAVTPPHQGKGIGSALVMAALDGLRDRGAAGCVVLGDPAWYARFGFAAAGELILPDVPADYFQALAFGPSRPRGTVRFDPAFDARE